MALKSIVAGGSAFAGKVSEKFDDLMFVALKVAAIGVACIAVYKYAGLRSGGDELAWLMLFGLGVIAVGFEYYGAQTLVDGWYDRALGGVVFGAALCIPALFLSYSNAISSAAVQQSQAAGLQKAAYFRTADTRKAADEAEEVLKKALAERSLLKPQRSAADARAVLDSAVAHKWWKTTDGCKATKGPQTRAFCDTYRSAEADIRAWDDISVADAKIATLKADVNEARSAASEAPATVSEVRADVLEYAAFFGGDAERGQVMQARHIAITITLFVTFTGFLTAWRRNRGRDVKPWGFITWLRRKWHVAWNGSEDGFDAGERSIVNNVSISDERAIAKLREMAERLRQAHDQPMGAAA